MPRFAQSRLERIYTLDEVVRWRCRFMTGWSGVDECAKEFLYLLEMNDALHPRWRRRMFPVRALRSFRWDEGLENPLIAAYVARRRAGGRFPPIIVVPWQSRPLDGNHRLRAAQIVGDEAIDAFVPVL